jgi:hypothetical protein
MVDQPQKPTPKETREQRLAKALRDNLRRRKAPPAQVKTPKPDA